MNLVVADTEEFRRVKRKQSKPAAAPGGKPIVQVVETDEKRTLGLIIIRGAQIVSVSAESPPADPSARLGKSAPGGISSTLTAGPGVAKPAGRGAPPPSLAVGSQDSSSSSSSETDSSQGPAAGVGGVAFPPSFPGSSVFGRGGASTVTWPPFLSIADRLSGPPPGYPGTWPPPGLVPNFPGPSGFNAPGGPPGAPPGPLLAVPRASTRPLAAKPRLALDRAGFFLCLLHNDDTYAAGKSPGLLYGGE